MATNESGDVGVSLITAGGVSFPHPSTVHNWNDNLEEWPNVSEGDIMFYFIQSKSCDMKEAKAYKSSVAYNYFQSGFVGKVFHSKYNGHILLKCEVDPSQRLNTQPHKVWACVEESGSIITCGCSCIAGLGKTCAHSAAMLFKVAYANAKGYTGFSCTSDRQTWNSGTKCNTLPDEICNMTFKKPSLTEPEANSSTQKNCDGFFQPRHFKTASEFQSSIKGDAVLSELCQPSTLLYAVVNAIPIFPSADENQGEPEIHTDHSNPTSGVVSCRLCNDFYQQFVVMTTVKMQQLQDIPQNSNIWKDSRRVRLTASTAKTVPKKAATDPAKFLVSHVFPRFKGNAATRHGQQHEAIAREKFKEETKDDVKVCGSVVCTQDPWLSASPDGLLCDNNTVLEIKCPLSQSITDLVNSAKYDVRRDKNGELYVAENGRYSYYLQMQLTMKCTNRKRGILYLWSEMETMFVNVPFNEKFVETKMSALRTFYFKYMLPKLTDLHLSNSLKLTEEFRTFCES